MTKSMTNLETEDVLSSIRKLVSERDPAKNTSVEAQAALFMLTPAHRVSHSAADVPDDDRQESPQDLDLSQAPVEIDDQPPVFLGADEGAVAATSEPTADPAASILPAEPVIAESQTDQSTEPGSMPDAAQASRKLLEARIAELERAVGRTGSEWEPDGSEPQDIHQPKLHFLERYRNRYDDDAPSEFQSDEVPADASGEDMDLTAAVVPQDQPDAMAEPEIEAVPQMPENSPEPEQEPELEPEPQMFEPEQNQHEVVEAGYFPAPERARNTEPPLILSEVAVFSHSPRIPDEPHTPVAEITADNAEAHDPAVAPVDTAEIGAPPPAAMPDDSASGGEVWSSDEELLVDEDVLRKVVADIVRDELQGRLGERITRNVRRMVRHEIEKAISLKSLK